MASVATAVLDHNRHPVAGVAITFPQGEAEPDALADAVRRTGETLARRLSGR
jgi:DNA-binding IclR family transcriptional regulator